jgi:hypothetical protein
MPAEKSAVNRRTAIDGSDGQHRHMLCREEFLTCGLGQGFYADPNEPAAEAYSCERNNLCRSYFRVSSDRP